MLSWTSKRNSASTRYSVADGENVTLTVFDYLGSSVRYTFRYLQRGYSYSYGRTGPTLVFKRVPLTVYQTQLNELNGRAQGIISAKAAAVARENAERSQRNFVQAIDRLAEQMRQFDQQADVHLARFPGAEKQYQAITAKVRDSVEKERRLAGNPNASVARSQLSIAATQASYETEQLHYQGQSLESSMAPITNQLPTDGEKLRPRCCQPPFVCCLLQRDLRDREGERLSACDRLRGWHRSISPKVQRI